MVDLDMEESSAKKNGGETEASSSFPAVSHCFVYITQQFRRFWFWFYVYMYVYNIIHSYIHSRRAAGTPINVRLKSLCEHGRAADMHDWGG